jgi:hypothetical protein
VNITSYVHLQYTPNSTVIKVWGWQTRLHVAEDSLNAPETSGNAGISFIGLIHIHIPSTPRSIFMNNKLHFIAAQALKQCSSSIASIA